MESFVLPFLCVLSNLLILGSQEWLIDFALQSFKIYGLKHNDQHDCVRHELRWCIVWPAVYSWCGQLFVAVDRGWKLGARKVTDKAEGRWSVSPAESSTSRFCSWTFSELTLNLPPICLKR
ncbi:hypothetical protein B0H19DRAFT_1084198 [Mycena capillaripes]|nr:hypothetical protein B0H19DRAFT_1084198 [Mycena capillaripes]